MQREVMEFDVLIGGGGPAGLSAALRLKQRAEASGTDISVCVIDKGPEIGAHILSGAVMDPRALNELVPDWRERGAPLNTPVTEDRFVFLTGKRSFALPNALLPDCLRNHGNYVISLGAFTRWLGQQAEAAGVEIHPGFVGRELLFDEDGCVIAVVTGDHTKLKPALEGRPIAYPKPDGVLTFDRPSSVFLSNTNHEEDQPCHLRLANLDVALRINLSRYDAPEQRYCPMGVYEIVRGLSDAPRLQVNAQNCVHCKTCRILDGKPPEGMTYELFLDQHGQKISKSKGNGQSVDEWLTYAPPVSLAQFMYNQPQRAKQLFFDVIPRAVDEYVANLEMARTQPVSVMNADPPETLWGFIRRYVPGACPETQPLLAQLVDHAITYYCVLVPYKQQYCEPDAAERAALEDLAEALGRLPADASAETIQNMVFAVGKRHPFPDLRSFFGCLYQVLLGQQEGPRFGGFVALYGIPETITLTRMALARRADAA